MKQNTHTEYIRNTKGLRMPDVYCLGTQKAATTTLYEILKQHPDTFLSWRKESKYFTNDEKYSKGQEWYMNEYLNDYANEKVILEIDPDYLFNEKVPNRMKKDVNPNTKFIVILRHPVDRAHSHFNMNCSIALEEESFEKALELEPLRMQGSSIDKKNFSYLLRGKYKEQILRYLEHFPGSNFLFLLYESNTKDINQALGKICKFIDVPSFTFQTNVNANTPVQARSSTLRNLFYGDNWLKRVFQKLMPDREKRRKILSKVNKVNMKPVNRTALDPKMRKALFEKHFATELSELSALTGLDLSQWKDK